MKFIVSGKNIEITEALRTKAIQKFGKLEKFFHKDVEAHITMSVEKTRQIVEVTIPFNGIVMRAEIANEDMYAAVDKAIDVIERQIRKNKTRLEKKLHEGILSFDGIKVDEPMEEEHEFKVVRTKRFSIKPMNFEEAILQMNLIGHEFFMFTNADTNRINVVYRRKSGDYGLIEPEA